MIISGSNNTITTIQRKDLTYSDPFKDWIRTPEELKSGDGYRLYDLDCVFWRYNTNNWCIAEVKCRNQGRPSIMKAHQLKTLEVMDYSLRLNPNIHYVGAFIFNFMATSPADGDSQIFGYDGYKWKELMIIKEEKQFIRFIQFIMNTKKKFI